MLSKPITTALLAVLLLMSEYNTVSKAFQSPKYITTVASAPVEDVHQYPIYDTF
jgi:hypothetical protein